MKLKRPQFKDIVAKIIPALGRFWMRYFSFIVVTLFLVVAMLFVFFWYLTLGGGGWTETQRDEYYTAQQKKISLNVAALERVKEELERREQARNERDVDVPDAFIPGVEVSEETVEVEQPQDDDSTEQGDDEDVFPVIEGTENTP